MKKYCIDENGNYCADFERTVDKQVEKFIDKNLPHWEQVGFNGCWSCDKVLKCCFGIENI